MAGTLPTWKLTGLFYIYCISGEVRSPDLGYGPKSYGLWAQSIREPTYAPPLPIHSPLAPIFLPCASKQSLGIPQPQPGW